MELLTAFTGIIIFSLYDYFGFHISYKKGWEDFTPINPYRISQSIIQLIITAILLIFFGWLSALTFNILWWTWWADLLFYLWYDLLRVFGYPRKPRGFREQVMGNKVTWAYWTAWGILRLKHKHEIMTWKEIFFQAIIGLIIVVSFYIFI